MWRFLIVSVACALVMASPGQRQKHAFKNVPNPCINNQNNQVYFPHPTDSTKFIQCDRYGRMYIIQCPENLLYSAATSTCKMSMTTETPFFTNIPPHNQQHNPCTQEALAAGNFYFAVPGDNTKFIECDMLGHANILPCAPSLVWNENRLSCVYKTGTEVANNLVTPSRGPLNPSGPDNLKNPCTPEAIAANKLYFAHPDPTKFIECDLWGDRFVVSCPGALVWNQYSETCVYAFLTVNGGAGK